MRSRPHLAAILSAALVFSALGSLAARAEVGASGTRLSVAGGAPRPYMTYGHIEEPELYAPIIPALHRLGVSFQRQGDDYVIYKGGQKLATWAVVTTREEVPETGNEPCVLVMGGNVFLPVRRVSKLLRLDIRWDKNANLVSMVPGAAPKVAAAVLTGVSVEQGRDGLVVHVQTGAPITPKWFTVKVAPARVVLDFAGAKWAEGLKLPEPVGVIKAFRTGTYEGRAARLVLEVSSAATRVTGVTVDNAEVLASIGAGAEAKMASITPGALTRMAIIDRSLIKPKSDRGSNVVEIPPGFGNPDEGEDPERFDPSLLPGLPARSLIGKTIVLDAGHGGHDVGAKGVLSFEKDLCLDMVTQFKQALEARGATVLLTRDSDKYVSLQERCDFANNSGADLFIAIHCNSMPHPNTTRGSEAYYNTSQSQKLAHLLHRKVVATVHGRDGGVRTCRFFVCRNTRMPSCLLEIAFINHVQDEQILLNGGFRHNLGENLANGVLEYFGSNRDASGG